MQVDRARVDRRVRRRRASTVPSSAPVPASTTDTGSPPVPRMSTGRAAPRRPVPAVPAGAAAGRAATRSGSTAARGLAAEQRQVVLGERQLGRGAAQLRPEHVRVLRVADGRLDRPAEDRLGMVHEVGVQRVVARHEDHQRPGPPRPARPACCHSEASVPGKPASTTASRPAMSMPSSRALVAATPSSCPRAQRRLQRAALLGQVAGAVRGDPVGQLRAPASARCRRAVSAISSAPRRERTKASVRAPSTTRSASSRRRLGAGRRAAPARRARRAASVSGGSHSAKRRPRRAASASSVTASTGSPVSRAAELRRVGRRRRREHEDRRRRRTRAQTRRSRRSTCATCEPKTPR